MPDQNRARDNPNRIVPSLDGIATLRVRRQNWSPLMPAQILAFGGSLRRDSWNHRIAEIAASGARDAGADTHVFHLADYPLPIFNEDEESRDAPPKEVAELRALFRAHQGMIIGCPEYNGSITAALKNAIDWLTRPEEGQPRLACFRNKVAGLVSASPGPNGGIRGLTPVRTILSHIQVFVVPQQVAVGQVHEALSSDGILTPESMHEQCLQVGRQVAEVANRLHH